LKTIGLINTVIIAWLLTPDDFGVVAISMISFAFLEAMSDANRGKALIRNKHMAREDYDSARTIKVMVGVGLTAAAFAITPLCAVYFTDERVVTAVQIISLRALFLGFKSTGVAGFRRDLIFREFSYWI
jgi:lipopolysaccharide exporter